jgi:hypothetical protein
MLRVNNVTKNSTLVDKGRVANNHWTRLKGLIGVKSLPPGDGLLIAPCRGVHCLFMSVAIDVLYVDGGDRVVAVDANMQPNTIGRPRSASRYVIELPAGTAARTGTQVGDQLRVHYP